MNELSLFTGGGGGVLASILLGWRTIGYVECEQYCCDRLVERMREGHLHSAPVWCGDIREFVRSGAAAEYRGLADVISAGFPCQPFSLAGKRATGDDSRNMWPATRDTIRAVRPEWLLLENVPALRCPRRQGGLAIDAAYFGTVLADLAELGFDAEWDLFSAAGVGAPHRRARLWIVAHANSVDLREQPLAKRWGRGTAKPSDDGQTPAVADANSHLLEESRDELAERRTAERDWWSTEPAVGRVADGVADRVDRLKALGNGQVPAVAVRAWRELSKRFQESEARK